MEWRLDLGVSDGRAVTVIERIQRTISDLSELPLALAVEGLVAWGLYGSVSPSAVIVAGGIEIYEIWRLTRIDRPKPEALPYYGGRPSPWTSYPIPHTTRSTRSV